jgi:hypothetical protein
MADDEEDSHDFAEGETLLSGIGIHEPEISDSEIDVNVSDHEAPGKACQDTSGNHDEGTGNGHEEPSQASYSDRVKSLEESLSSRATSANDVVLYGQYLSTRFVAAALRDEFHLLQCSNATVRAFCYVSFFFK